MISHVKFEGHVCVSSLPTLSDSSPSGDVHLLVNGESLITAAAAVAGVFTSAFRVGHP